MYTSKRIGVHLVDEEIVVDQEISSNDENKYDFVFYTEITRDYNGNKDYEVNLEQTGRRPDLYGWKIQYIRLPGNWFGNHAYVELTDFAGHSYTFDTKVDNWHFSGSECRYLKRVMERVIDFCYENYTAEYASLNDSFEGYKEEMKFSDFVKIHFKMQDVIDVYNTYSKQLNKNTSVRDKVLLKNLKQKVCKCIEKAYKISVSI